MNEIKIISDSLLYHRKHPCPSCKNNTIGYLSIPADSGWTDQFKAKCNSCGEVFLMDQFLGMKRSA